MLVFKIHKDLVLWLLYKRNYKQIYKQNSGAKKKYEDGKTHALI